MAKNQARIVYSPQQKAIRAVLWVLLAFFAVLVIFPMVAFFFCVLDSKSRIKYIVSGALLVIIRRTGSECAVQQGVSAL